MGEGIAHSLDCARILLQVVRCLLFGTGGPRYAQRPALGGMHFQDLVEAGSMVRRFYYLTVTGGLTLPRFCM
jgi:hypothetical protein